MKIQATTTKKDAAGKTVPDRKVEIEYNVPDKLDDQVKAFGSDVVAAAAQDSIVISLQAYMRALLKKGKPDTEVKAEAGKWRPNVRNVIKQTAFEKATSAITSLTPEERAALLKQLQAVK